MPESFTGKIYAVLKQIPRGKVMTYQGLSKKAGFPRAARAAGNALHKNEHPIVVPCHRVVRSDGAIGGYALGTPKKIELLKAEGIEIRSGKIVDLSSYLYE